MKRDLNYQTRTAHSSLMYNDDWLCLAKHTQVHIGVVRQKCEVQEVEVEGRLAFVSVLS